MIAIYSKSCGPEKLLLLGLWIQFLKDCICRKLLCISVSIARLRVVVYPTNCNDCVCQVHYLFGMKFHEQMSCRCGTCLDEKECTTIFHKLDMGSPQTTKIKSFVELPVLMDELLCYEDKCECCGSLKNIDHFLSNTPHFFTIVLNWLGGNESQVSLSELLAGIVALHLPLTSNFCTRVTPQPSILASMNGLGFYWW